MSDIPIYALCINVIDRETGEVEAQKLLFPSEVTMPGFVQSTERQYDNTPWRTERIWLLSSVKAEFEADQS